MMGEMNFAELLVDVLKQALETNEKDLMDCTCEKCGSTFKLTEETAGQVEHLLCVDCVKKGAIEEKMSEFEYFQKYFLGESDAENSFKLGDLIGLPALLEQTAEECNELAHALLKYSRKLRGENPTPNTLEKVQKNVLEETVDVLICINELCDSEVLPEEEVSKMLDYKIARMSRRMREFKNEKDN